MKHLKLQLTDKVAIVDDEDFDRLSNYKWWISPSGNITRKFSQDNHTVHISLAVEIMRKPKQMHDHIDRNSLNNQKYNLRECNYSQNAANTIKKKGRTSKYKGVFLNRRDNNWRAVIRFHHRLKGLGTFKTEDEAGLAYDKKAKELFGDFAVLNFPSDI